MLLAIPIWEAWTCLVASTSSNETAGALYLCTSCLVIECVLTGTQQAKDHSWKVLTQQPYTVNVYEDELPPDT